MNTVTPGQGAVTLPKCDFTTPADAGKPAKPSKPRPNFPLFPHATGRWAKKIRGQMHCFGPWDDPDGALKKYLEQKDDLQAGRKPREAADLARQRLAKERGAGQLHLGCLG